MRIICIKRIKATRENKKQFWALNCISRQGLHSLFKKVYRDKYKKKLILQFPEKSIRNREFNNTAFPKMVSQLHSTWQLNSKD